MAASAGVRQSVCGFVCGETTAWEGAQPKRFVPAPAPMLIKIMPPLLNDVELTVHQVHPRCKQLEIRPAAHLDARALDLEFWCGLTLRWTRSQPPSVPWV